MTSNYFILAANVSNAPEQPSQTLGLEPTDTSGIKTPATGAVVESPAKSHTDLPMTGGDETNSVDTGVRNGEQTGTVVVNGVATVTSVVNGEATGTDLINGTGTGVINGEGTGIVNGGSTVVVEDVKQPGSNTETPVNQNTSPGM